MKNGELLYSTSGPNTYSLPFNDDIFRPSEQMLYKMEHHQEDVSALPWRSRGRKKNAYAKI